MTGIPEFQNISPGIVQVLGEDAQLKRTISDLARLMLARGVENARHNFRGSHAPPAARWVLVRVSAPFVSQGALDFPFKGCFRRLVLIQGWVQK